jgi:heme/copper-type cytochrome/quinol oxidase subunit 3
MSDVGTALREPWPDLDRQREGVTVGIWLFIASEVLFFGALFLGYAVYRTLYSEAFRIAGAQTEVFYGSVNLLLLLTSSVTMTVAVDASRWAMRRVVILCLVLTMLLGTAFLIFKGFEYNADIAKGLVPGPHFPLQPPQTQLFWALYWVMTGVHAIHLAVGIGIVGVFAWMFWRRLLPIESPAILGVATYWHFVDTVWIILFPLLYLINRS